MHEAAGVAVLAARAQAQQDAALPCLGVDRPDQVEEGACPSRLEARRDFGAHQPGLMRDFWPVAWRPYTAIASSRSAPASETSSV
jgi:hypothetical protein